MPTPTTEYDRLLKAAFTGLYPAGSARNSFPPRGARGYQRVAKPDFVLPDGRWLDFKLHVSYREKSDVPWRPSALYSSLRKYLDHSANVRGTLGIVYRHLHGSLSDVSFPITRGEQVLVKDAADFEKRVVLVDVEKFFKRIKSTNAAWVVENVRHL
jgi:hypothetical protein